MQKPQSMGRLLQFKYQNIEIKIKKIISDLKEASLLHKTGISFFWVTKININL